MSQDFKWTKETSIYTLAWLVPYSSLIVLIYLQQFFQKSCNENFNLNAFWHSAYSLCHIGMVNFYFFFILMACLFTKVQTKNIVILHFLKNHKTDFLEAWSFFHFYSLYFYYGPTEKKKNRIMLLHISIL